MGMLVSVKIKGHKFEGRRLKINIDIQTFLIYVNAIIS
jgi:hypothetical protein